MSFEAIKHEALELFRADVERRKRLWAARERKGIVPAPVSIAAYALKYPVPKRRPWSQKRRDFAIRVAPHLTYAEWEEIGFACTALARQLGSRKCGIAWLENHFEGLHIKDGRLIIP